MLLQVTEAAGLPQARGGIAGVSAAHYAEEKRAAIEKWAQYVTPWCEVR